MKALDLIQTPFVSSSKAQILPALPATLLTAPAPTRLLSGGTVPSPDPPTLTTAAAEQGPALLASGHLSTSRGHLLPLTHLPRLDLWVGTIIAFEFGCPKHVVNVPKGIDANSRASPAGNKTERGSGRHWPSLPQLGHGCVHHAFADRVHSGCFPPTRLPETLKGRKKGFGPWDRMSPHFAKLLTRCL